jgi:hypothetical protein
MEAEARNYFAGEAQQQFNQATDRWHCVSEQSQIGLNILCDMWSKY